MQFDQEAVKKKALDHLMAMAVQPGWKAQAWHSAKALAQDWPDMFGDLPQQLTAAMLKKSSGERPKTGE